MELAQNALPPKPGTYWVLEGKLLTGPYPGASDATVRPLLDAGITTFLNLMEPDARNHVGNLFTSYEAAIDPIATMVRHPIVDMSIPTKAEMVAILDVIDKRLENSGVYLHCWGGVGRTGTVVGCWLLRHGLATPDNVIAVIADLRKADPVRGHRTSPETPEQRRFIAE
jgi:hypothetical protein